MAITKGAGFFLSYNPFYCLVSQGAFLSVESDDSNVGRDVNILNCVLRSLTDILAVDFFLSSKIRFIVWSPRLHFISCGVGG